MFLLLIASLVGSSLAFNIRACGDVTVVSRAEWGSRSTSTSNMALPVAFLFIHHTAGAECSTRESCSAQMRSIQNFHMDGNGWADIGYNYLVGGDGAVYEGRGWGKVGAHTFGYNSVAVAISLMGNFVSSTPSAAMLQATRDLIDCAETQGVLTTNYRMFGHRDGGCTECPGSALYSEIQSWPRFSFDVIEKFC